MSHIISGRLRKAPYIKQGVGEHGASTMYAIELVEVLKDRNGGNPEYTNYQATFFAKSPNAVAFYEKAFADGSFVVVNCEKLRVIRSECGQYIKLRMESAKLEGVNAVDDGQPARQQAAPAQQQGGWGNRQQPAPQQQYNEPPMDDFSDDIPF